MTDYEVKPITSNCVKSTPLIIKPSEGSQTSETLNNIDNQKAQLLEDTRFDTINDDSTSSPMTGGLNKKKRYNINFINKKYIIYDNNEIDAIKNIIKNKNYKKENILSINKSLYLIKNNNNNNKNKNKNNYNNIKKIL